MNEDKCPSMCPTSYDLYCQAIALKELVLIEKLEAHVDLMMNHVEECKECNEHTCNGPSRSEHIDKCQKCFDAMANIVNEKKESLKKKTQYRSH